MPQTEEELSKKAAMALLKELGKDPTQFTKGAEVIQLMIAKSPPKRKGRPPKDDAPSGEAGKAQPEPTEEPLEGSQRDDSKVFMDLYDAWKPDTSEGKKYKEELGEALGVEEEENGNPNPKNKEEDY